MVSVNVEQVGPSQQGDWACDSEWEGLKFVETWSSTPMALPASESL